MRRPEVACGDAAASFLWIVNNIYFQCYSLVTLTCTSKGERASIQGIGHGP